MMKGTEGGLIIKAEQSAISHRPYLNALLLILVAVAAIFVFWPRSQAAAAPPVDVAIDTDPSGNSPNSLGSTDYCRQASIGDTIDVDVVLRGVPPLRTDGGGGLSGYQATFSYDRAVLKVVGIDYEQMPFQASPSIPITFIDDLPDSDGTFSFAVADFGNPGESGDGVLARLTFEVVGGPYSLLEFVQDGPAQQLIVTDGTGIVSYDVQSAMGGLIQVSSECTSADEPPLLPQSPGGESSMFLAGYFETTYQPADGWDFYVSGGDSRIVAHVVSPLVTLEMEFIPSTGEIIMPGVYPETRGFFNTADYPIFRFISTNTDDYCCLSSSVSVSINDITFDDSGVPNSLSLTFWDQFSFGELRINSEDPVVALELSASVLDFEHQSVGFPSDPLTLEITNVGSVPAHGLDVYLDIDEDYPWPSVYDLTANNCPSEFAPRNSCQVDVVFTPLNGQFQTPWLVVEDGELGHRYLIHLAGRGHSPSFPDFNPDSLGFGTVAVGDQLTLPFTIQNDDEYYKMKIDPLEFREGSSSAYSIFEDGCSGVDLDPGEECVVQITYAPLNVGQHFARFDVAGNYSISREFQIYGNSIPQVTPSPNPYGTSTPIPSITPVPSPTPLPTPTPLPGTNPPTTTPLPTGSSLPTRTNADVTATATPTVTSSDRPTATATSTATPTVAAETETPIATPTDTTTPTASAHTTMPTATATPNPTPPPVIFGDLDCDQAADGKDALALLLFIADGSEPPTASACSPTGAAASPMWGDLNCDLQVNHEDLLAALRAVAGLPYTHPADCPFFGGPLS